MLKLLTVLAFLNSGLTAGLEAFERAMVYPFDPARVAPARAGVPQLREIEFPSRGETLVIWVSPPKGDAPTILYFHGNAGNLADRAQRFQLITARGYGLVAPAYRGSSGSTGTPSEPALTRDARRIWRKLHRLIPGLTPDKTVIYGESLGTGVTLKMLAGRNLAAPAGVVLEAPYTSLPDVARTAYPQLTPLLGQMRNTWNSLAHIRTLRAPLLVLHGTADRVVPIKQGRQVFAAAPSKRKQFLALPGAGHTDTWRTNSLPALWAFIDDTSGR